MLIAGAAPSSTRALSCHLTTPALTDLSFSAATPVVASASFLRWSFNNATSALKVASAPCDSCGRVISRKPDRCARASR